MTCKGADGTTRTSPQGRFKTPPPPGAAAPVRMAWVADYAGQGWGISPNPEVTTVGTPPFNGRKIKGGYLFADIVASLEPDFIVLNGDNIYADNVR